MAKTETTETTEKTETAKPKTVKIKLPRIKGEPDEVFVSVNQRTYLIKRGEEVVVPEFVKEVLDHQEEMLDSIAAFEAKQKQKK